MDEIIAWLIKLIDYDTTISGRDAGLCADFIDRTLKERGVMTERFTTSGSVREGCHLVAEVPGKSSFTVLLHAHLDTAAFGEQEEWIVPADRASRLHDRVFGRGALDCKGPLAVWMKLLTDAAERKKRGFTLRLLVTDLEEEGGRDGIGKLIDEHPGILSDVSLVIGEGGGYPFPYKDKIIYTFQTGERDYEDTGRSHDNDIGYISGVLSAGIRKGYYSEDILSYVADAPYLYGRRLDIRPLYDGMEEYFERSAPSDVFSRYGKLFEKSLIREVPNAYVLPVITPGFSDNRRIRKTGLPMIGFFPLDIGNHLGGIHGKNEYISEASLALAYRTMSAIFDGLPV